MSHQISKSPEIIAKEAIIKKLQAQLKKKKTKLKGLKTRLQNTKEDITKIQREGTGKMFSKVAEMEKVRLEVVELVKKLLKLKGLNREDKHLLRDMQETFESDELFGDGFQEMKEQMEEMEEMKSGNYDFNFDEEQRAKMRDMFEQFAVKPDEQEQKNIRKIFIRLSQKFHPDKASNEKDGEDYHEMMQKINEAYQAGDIDTLLELEQLFLSEKLDLTKVQSLSVDVLQQEIDRLERDLEFIDNQIDRNNGELKSLRASDLGKMLKDVKKAEKQGQGIDDMADEMQVAIDRLQSMKEGLEHSLEIKALSPKLAEIMMGQVMQNDNVDDEMKAMLMDMMGGEDVDLEEMSDFFGSLGAEGFDIGYEENPKPKFKIDSSVKIKNGLHGLDEETNLKGMVGRVQTAYIDETGQKIYEVELDSLSLKKFPIALVDEAIGMDADFQNIEVLESQLEKTKARDQQEDAIATYKILHNNSLWSYCAADVQERLKAILLKEPLLSDSENWETHFEKLVKFPIEVRSRGMLDFRKGEKMKLLGIEGSHHEIGVIVLINYRNQKTTYPLLDLLPTAKNKSLKELFDDYFVYANEMYEF